MNGPRLKLLREHIEITKQRHWASYPAHDATGVAEMLAELAEEVLVSLEVCEARRKSSDDRALSAEFERLAFSQSYKDKCGELRGVRERLEACLEPSSFLERALAKLKAWFR